jgi:hypothetical protein
MIVAVLVADARQIGEDRMKAAIAPDAGRGRIRAYEK